MTGRRNPGTVDVRNHQGTERSVEMLMTGVLPKDRSASREDVRGHAVAARDSAVPVPEKQLHRWTNEGGAVLPHD
jgi:hypothetical protein